MQAGSSSLWCTFFFELDELPNRFCEGVVFGFSLAKHSLKLFISLATTGTKTVGWFTSDR
jgi:hypothetical protein